MRGGTMGTMGPLTNFDETPSFGKFKSKSDFDGVDVWLDWLVTIGSCRCLRVR